MPCIFEGTIRRYSFLVKFALQYNRYTVKGEYKIMAHTCKICGSFYPLSIKNCPRCGQSTQQPPQHPIAPEYVPPATNTQEKQQLSGQTHQQEVLVRTYQNFLTNTAQKKYQKEAAQLAMQGWKVQSVVPMSTIVVGLTNALTVTYVR